MRFGSLCSGIEAASVAWAPLGWQAAWVAEIEPFPCAVLAHHYPAVSNLGDITASDFCERALQHGPVDVVVGGTPCQSFSVAGLRGGLADPRGNLALVFLAIIDRLRPTWMVWENVPGVLSSNGGRDFGSFLGALAKLGYGFAYRVLDAQYAGLAQRRKRVFVVGHSGDWRRAAAVLFERHSLSGDTAPSREAGKDVAGRAAFGIDSGCVDRSGEGANATARERSGLGVQAELSSSLRAKRPNAVAFGGNNTSGPIDVATACNAGGAGRLDFESETFVAYQCHGSNVGEMGTLRAGNGNTAGGVPFTLAHCFDARQNAVISYGDKTGPLDQNGQTHGVVVPAIADAMQVRRLLPVECEKLQGFPPGYTDVPFRGKPAADGNRYKALGNSMAVPVVRWIGERIELVENTLEPRKGNP